VKYQSKRSKRERIYRRIGLYLYVLIVLTALFIAVYFFMYSRFTKVEGFETTNLQESTDEAQFIEEMRLQAGALTRAQTFGLDNFFAWDSELEYIHPEYTAVKMQKSFRDRIIRFDVEQRKRFANWCKETESGNEQVCYWVDEVGVAFESAPASSGQLIFSITEIVENAHFTPGEKLVERNFGYVIAIASAVRGAGIELSTVTIDRALQELKLTTSNRTEIIFSLRFDPMDTAIPALLEFAGDPGLGIMRELNLAVENRAFFTPF